MDVAWLQPGRIWRDKEKDLAIICLARQDGGNTTKIVVQREGELLCTIYDLDRFLDGRFTYGEKDDN